MNKTKGIFTTVTPVRITDINYGMHVGLPAIAGIFHNARVLFLNKFGFNEMDIDGVGIIQINANYRFKHETLFNMNLRININISTVDKSKFVLKYQALNDDNGLMMVEAEEEFACFDYKKKRLVRVPDAFVALYKQTDSLE